MPRKGRVNDYQDMADTQCQLVKAMPSEIDPIRDIAILKTTLQWSAELPHLGNLDACKIADSVGIFGYPHCTQGRRAFTFLATAVGAKVLMDNQGIKSRHSVINTQARPGQSGSPVIDTSSGLILGMLIGAWVPGPPGVILGDINPYELNQTTHCISAHHIKEML